jgi:RNA polymerase sigma-70 factor (ECF subfamily)
MTAADDAQRREVERLLKEHLNGLRAFVRLRAGPVVRSREAESDVVQSACREVLSRAHDYRHGGEAGFRHWLYTAALRKIVDKHERHTATKRDVRREQSLSTADEGAQDAALLATYQAFASPSQVASAREQLDRVEAAFAQLGEDHREAILLSRVVGLSRAEVAAEMGRSEASVRNLLHRALMHLARLLEEPEP